MPFTEPYIFPYSNLDELGYAVANRFRDMLLQGAPNLGQDGLNTRPIFIHREGTGTGRDKNLTTTAEVRFIDDGPGSIPYVMILGIQPSGPLETYGDYQSTLRITVAMNCTANGSMPYGASVGFNAKRADTTLGGFVWHMTSREDVMEQWGFTDVQARPEPPTGGVLGRDGQPYVFAYPVTVDCEIYIWREGYGESGSSGSP